MQFNFNENAAAVLKLMAHESRRLGDDYVCSEHLLLAALQSTPKNLLNSLSISQARLIERVEQRLAHRRLEIDHVLTPGCQTPHVKRAIINSQQRATAENRAVEVRDIWHSLLQDEICVELLREFGLNPIELVSHLS